MRLLLFSLFLVSVSVRSAPLGEAKLNVTGVVREGRDDDDDCCQPRETPCWTYRGVHCYWSEWVSYRDSSACFYGWVQYGCCGRCECKCDNGLCHPSNMPDQDNFNPPGG